MCSGAHAAVSLQRLKRPDQVEAPKCGFGKCQLELSAKGPRPGEMLVPNRPYGGRYAGKFSCTDSGHVMALVPGPESGPWLVLFTMIGTAIKFTAKHSRYAQCPSGKAGDVGSLHTHSRSRQLFPAQPEGSLLPLQVP